jgi:hypothetical protein
MRKIDENKKNEESNKGKVDEEQLLMEAHKVVAPDNRNGKEKLYDKIPISLKTLDIVIGILVAILVILLLYFIIRRFS